MTATTTRADAELRQRIDASAQAIRDKNIDTLMTYYAPDVVTFDLMPLEMRGTDAYRKNFTAWFAVVQGPIDYWVSDLRITSREDIAFCHYLARVRSTGTDGEKRDYVVRVTACLGNLNGKWLITHEHVSVPFADVKSMRAALAAGSTF